MQRITQFELEGLFGYVRHTVNFRQDAPTIVTAPNGAGKTHILRIITGILSLDFYSLLSAPFGEARLTFSDGRSIVVERNASTDEVPALVFTRKIGEDIVGAPVTVSEEDLESTLGFIPDHFQKIDYDAWIDLRTGKRVDYATLRRRYRTRLPISSRELGVSGGHSFEMPPAIFIDTKRLDVSTYDDQFWQSSRSPGTESSHSTNRIGEYIEEIRRRVAEARRQSVLATQKADLSFAARALEVSQAAVKEQELRRRYELVVNRYNMLAKNSLAVGDALIPFPEKTTPTVRRILNVFLDDWDKRLKPLLPLNERIQTLRDILDDKLAGSGKRTTMSDRGALEFGLANGSPVDISHLSSGEQHLVALFTRMLFSAKRGSIVLIDEPEISLHATWKHAFLDDISRVADIRGLQIVLATHSSAIVNGCWDLVEQLKLVPARPAEQLQPSNVQSVGELDDDD